MKIKIILLLLNYLVFLNSVSFCSTSMLIIIHLFISRNALLMKFWEFYLNLYIILLHIFSNNLIAYQDVLKNKTANIPDFVNSLLHFHYSASLFWLQGETAFLAE